MFYMFLKTGIQKVVNILYIVFLDFLKIDWMFYEMFLRVIVTKSCVLQHNGAANAPPRQPAGIQVGRHMGPFNSTRTL